MSEKPKIITLLAGLKGQGVEINTRSLARFTAENGVLAKIRCGRIRGRIGLPPKFLGIRPDKWKKGDQEFFNGHVAMGTLCLIPKELEAKLNQLDTRARRLLESNCINGSYMPLMNYEGFKKEFEEIRKEYLDTIDEVANGWEEIRENFLAGATSLVYGRRGLLKRDKDALLRDVKNAIPTAARYRESAYMTLEVRAFPTTGVTVDGLANDIQDEANATWRDDTVYNAVSAIEAQIGLVFAQACKAAKIFARSGKMDARNLEVLVKTAAKAGRMNVFGNPMLKTISDRLSNLAGKLDDEVEELVEESILDAVSYAKATNLKLDMECCPFTESQLEDMLSLRMGGAEA